MNLVPVDPNVITLSYHKHAYCKAVKIIESFMESSHEAVRMEPGEGEYASFNAMVTTYRKAIKLLHVDCIVCCRQRTMYLIKGGVVND